MAKVIKENFADCKVTFMARGYTAPLLNNNRYVDEVILLEEEEGAEFYKVNLRKIKKQNFDACFIVSPSFKTALLAVLAGVKIRVSTGYRWYSFLFTHKVFEHRKYGVKNELEHNLEFLKFWPGKWETPKEPASFGLQINKAALDKVKKILSSAGIDISKPLIIIHPGSGGSAVDWPVKNFRQLAELIDSSLDAGVVITGSEKEGPVCSVVSENLKSANLAGRFNLEELAALISLAGIFISNSTGPLHIAAALGVNVVGFYPKIAAASPVRWGPYTEKAVIFQPVINCVNCSREQCEQLNCMESITAENVFITIGKIYKLLLKNGENNV
jgi:ADP-heptose:LPS heptosyltransferase